MDKRTILYRGDLKSCNYHCSYCPFSKHRSSAAELDRDREHFARFCHSVEERARELSLGAVLVVPYGEASIHSWYWEGLGRLAAVPGIDRVGMQTNLSFPVEECLERFWQHLCLGKKTWGGCTLEEKIQEGRTCREKLCLWATFHPEMTDVDAFVAKCHQLAGNGVRLCAGAVGVPANIPLLQRLRWKLSPDIYLWINKMDGLGRNYRSEEIHALSRIDLFFERELAQTAARVELCADRCFVEADGRMHSCNISRVKAGNWYESDREAIFRPLCGQKRCSCYLAYGGRADFAGRQFFGEYPMFRIPRRFRAVFFDLDGTLLEKGDRRGMGNGGMQDTWGLPEEISRYLAALGQTCQLFLATSLPEEEARKRIREDMELFRGGVFASGAHVWVRAAESQEGQAAGRGGAYVREAIYPVDASCLPELGEFAEKIRARVKAYRKNQTVYKITLAKRHNSIWKEQECSQIEELLKQTGSRIFVEENCLEIVGRDRNKGTGLKEICEWLDLSPGEVLAVGNDREDESMGRVQGVCFLKMSVPGKCRDADSGYASVAGGHLPAEAAKVQGRGPFA